MEILNGDQWLRVYNRCNYDIGVALMGGASISIKPGNYRLMTVNDILYIENVMTSAKFFTNKMLVAVDDDGADIAFEEIGSYPETLGKRLRTIGETLEKTKSSIGLLAISNAGDLNDPTTMARLVRAGMGETAYPVGSQVTVTHSVYGDLVFDVVAHNFHKKTGDENAPTMTLMMHDTIPDISFDAAELLWANTTGKALPAGTYNFALYYGGFNKYMMIITDTDGTYQFTTTKEIPKNGGFRHSTIGLKTTTDKSGVTGGTITTYDASGTVVESDLAVTEGSEGTALGTASGYKKFCVNTVGTFNSSLRNASGSNNWAESDTRQWLNSTAAASKWWDKRTPFDLPSGYASKAGFLNGFDRTFLKAIGAVTIETTSNSVYEYDTELNTAYTTNDKMFLRCYDDPYDDEAESLYGIRNCFSSLPQMMPLYSINYGGGYWGTMTGFPKDSNEIQSCCVIC